jgi:hypothetical protein
VLGTDPVPDFAPLLSDAGFAIDIQTPNRRGDDAGTILPTWRSPKSWRSRTLASGAT